MAVGVLSNPILLEAARENGSAYSPLYAAWAIDNLLLAGVHEEAIDAADSFERRWSQARDRRGELILESVLRQSAACSRVLDDYQMAEATWHRLIRLQERESRREAWPWYELGLLAEERGQKTAALRYYGEAARRMSSDPRDLHANDCARRNAARLRSRSAWVRPSPDKLAKELMRALRRRDRDAVSALVSRTHFSLGVVGGHPHFADPGAVLPDLLHDMLQSRIYGNPEVLEGTGQKRYLRCGGWLGETFFGSIQFVLTQAPSGGWEWSGVAVEGRAARTQDLLREVFGEAPPKSNHRLLLRIKAPWPAPLAFQAGGLYEYLAFEGAEALALVAAAGAVTAGCAAANVGFLGCLAILGPGVIASVLGVFAAARLARSGACGWGPSGFYYNQEGHSAPSGDEQYAIDFASWSPYTGEYPQNMSHGTPVLACHSGEIVRTVRSHNRGDSDPSHANFVDQHLLESVADPVRYTARYLHLDGPWRLEVSDGQWVEQGWLLGYMDDTGMSQHSHLHFVIHDNTIPPHPDRFINVGGLPVRIAGGSRYGGSVRPTPMGTETLNDDEEGKCIVSDNHIANMEMYCQVLFDELRTLGGRGVTEDQQRFLEVFEHLCGRMRPTVSAQAPEPRQAQAEAPRPRVACIAPREPCPDGTCRDLSSDPTSCGVCGLSCGVGDDGLPRECREGRCR